MTLLDFAEHFAPFENRMRAAGINPVVIHTFKRNYMQLLSGSTGHISGSQIDPVNELPDAHKLDGYVPEGVKALGSCAVIKLNGGLGTSMGLSGAKSLIPVRDGKNFLDLFVQQIRYLRETYQVEIPILLMNSFRTRDDSMAVLDRYPDLASGIPSDFLQHRIPKVLTETLSPLTWPADRSLEWCPPGHGDLYPALVTSGLLDLLLSRGIRFAFISNADNLGAVPDLNILGYISRDRIPFLMEVADRTPADRKGGHLAFLKDGRFTLREVAQCPPDEIDEFQDIRLHRYFNTNNLWIHLPSLKGLLDRFDNILPLSLIRNRKKADPADSGSPEVFQLESAMGAAISLFDSASAMRVPRSRFSPVKTTGDLLVVRSDASILTDSGQLVQHPDRTSPAPVISLDNNYFGTLDQFDTRFPFGVPSLVECETLVVEGDVHFGKNVRVVGKVTVRAEKGMPGIVADGSVLEN